jgi:hypothetical protein
MQNNSSFFCDHCKKETHFVPIHRAIAIAGVSRSTVRYWMHKGWVHVQELPSGRKVICLESLHHGEKSPKPLSKGAVA